MKAKSGIRIVINESFDVTNIKHVQRHISNLHNWKRARARKDLPVDVLEDALAIAYVLKEQLQRANVTYEDNDRARVKHATMGLQYGYDAPSGPQDAQQPS